MNKTSILIGTSLLISLMAIPMASAASTAAAPCSGALAINCQDGAYTWCSANDGGPGYRSSTGTCAPGYQPQDRSGHHCSVFSDLTTPPLCVN